MEIAALLARWNALPAKVRVTLCSAASLMALVSLAATFLMHPPSAALFAQPLHPEQLSEVEEQLAAWSVPFTPADDNVVVGAKRRNDLLLRLSMAGVPHDHIEPSAAVLGKLGALTPQSIIDAQTRDGLAGDIELGLRGIDGVEDARVIIAPAKAGYFADESGRDASASVRLRLTPGARLSHDAIAGIRAFVAASVPGLDAANVMLVDDRGIALGQNQDANDAADLQRSLQSALDAAIGDGAAIVRVHVDYDSRAIASKDVRRSAASPIAISASSQSESYTAQGKRYGRSQQQIDRGSESREITTSMQPGRVSRISAAVIVDASRGVSIAQVKSLAAAALGLDERRGDSVDVQAVEFAHPRAARKDAWWLAYGALVPLLPALVLAIAVLIAARFAQAPLTALLRAIGARASLERTAQNVRGIPAANVRGALLNEPPHAAAAIISALPAATAAAVLDMYPQHERAAIIKRMQRPASPLLPDAEEFIAKA